MAALWHPRRIGPCRSDDRHLKFPCPSSTSFAAGLALLSLLLMITKTVEPQVLEESTIVAEGRVAELTEQLFEIRGETTVLNRDLAAKQEQISEFEEQIAILQGALATSSRAMTRYKPSKCQQHCRSVAIARQELSEEEERLLGRSAERKNQLIGGIPSIASTSFSSSIPRSMFSYAWERMLREMEATLNIYPNVKGIQVMNDMGNYLFSRYAGQWIPDTPAQRQLILRNLANWNAFSNSSPVEGITQAVRSFYDRDKKISIYVFGMNSPDVQSKRWC